MERVLARLAALERRMEHYARAYLELRRQVRELEQKLREFTSR